MLPALVTFLSLLALFLPFVYALETNGISVLQAPAPNSDQHAGSDLVIAIDISNNGQISPSSNGPDSGAPTRITSLDLYLISRGASQNLTITEGPGFLTQEPGSTVKHLNWHIPRCAAPGLFFLAIYETAYIDNVLQFAQTDVPFPILNTAPSDDCEGAEQNPYIGPTGPPTPKLPESDVPSPSSPNDPADTMTSINGQRPLPTDSASGPTEPTGSPGSPGEGNQPGGNSKNPPSQPTSDPTPTQPQGDPITATAVVIHPSLADSPSRDELHDQPAQGAATPTGQAGPTQGETPIIEPGGIMKTATWDGPISSFIPINNGAKKTSPAFSSVLQSFILLVYSTVQLVVIYC